MLTMRQKIALSRTIKNRYQKSTKKDKVVILNEFVASTGYNRSYARRILGAKTKGIDGRRKKKIIVRKRVYDASVFYALRKIWVAADGICGKRLKPFVGELLQVLERHDEIKLNKTVRAKVLTVSSATIDRILGAIRRQYRLKGRSTTKPGSLLKQSIQVRTFADWDDRQPGFFEVDLVAFCGDSVRDDFVNGLNLTDVFTGWVGLDAVMGKASSRVNPAIDGVRRRLPFTMLGLDSDNGSEFINQLLKRYCEQYKITFTRSRPYKKNDNCYVEQKNYTVMRRFLGYARFDTDVQLNLVRQILKQVEIYVNFFQPIMKLVEKQRIGSKVKKHYDVAKTPYQRLLSSDILTEQKKQQLQTYYESLNPMLLKRRINTLSLKLEKTLRYKIPGVKVT